MPFRATVEDAETYASDRQTKGFYEHTGRRGVAEGWWQGHEAWSNVCAGALVGVAYGAASLWPWRLHPDEPGHGAYVLCEGAGWREALDFEGSRYVGLVGKILDRSADYGGMPTLGRFR
jgi:hypothetical protein